MALEEEARQAGITFAALLDRMAQNWLSAKKSPQSDADEQARLHALAAEMAGSISSGQSNRAENVRELVRKRLREKHGR